MKKREFGVSFAVEASPWPVTSPGWEWQTGIFLGGFPEDCAPPFFSFLIVLFVVGAPTLPSLSFSSCVSRRTRAVVRSGCLPQNHLLLGSWALDIVSGGCYQRSHHLRPDREALCGLQPTVD